jgi:phosphomevalonate kinase
LSIIASAPGKIVLSGEYAVLFGAPAICMAVDRRAVVGLQPAAECRLRTPGFTGDAPFAVVDAVSPGNRPPLEIELDTSAFAEQGNKIGIGSSAALTVALTAGLEKTTDVLDEAMRAHARLQGAAGSGVDIAAAVHGGLIRYTQAPRSVQRLAWPDGLALRVIWTGMPASTSARLQKLANRATQQSCSALLLAAAIVADAWATGDARRIVDEYRPYIGVLREFSVDHDLGIFDAGHDELTDAAMADGLIYKPAGAGGGDIGVLLGTSEAELDAFVGRHRDLIHDVVPCALDPHGVRLEQA